MPAVSKKQERFMQAVANNPKFAKQVGVPQSVGKEFTKSGGGTVDNTAKGPQVNEEFRKPRGTEASDEKKRRMAAEMKRQQEMRDKIGANAPMEPTDADTMGMKKGGMACGSKTKKYAKGGEAHSDMGKDMPMMKKEAKKAVKAHEAKMHKGTKKMASGGRVRGAGCAQRGVRPAKMR